MSNIFRFIRAAVPVEENIIVIYNPVKNNTMIL